MRASGSRVARIYTPHGGSLHYDPKPLKNRVYFAAERFFETMTDAFIFVSRYEANAYAAKVHPPKPIAKVIPNGLREDEFVAVPPAADARDFLYVGMLRDLKGVDVFINALAALRDRGLPHTANIFGAGDDAARYRTMVAALRLDEAVTFHEPTPARIAFATGRVLVIPSRAESMPYIVLEAAAAAVPMIATRVGGIPEIFGEKSDRLVEPGSVESLAAAMQNAAADPAATARKATDLREEVGRVHTVDAMAASVEAVYRAAIARRRGAT